MKTGPGMIAAAEDIKAVRSSGMAENQPRPRAP